MSNIIDNINKYLDFYLKNEWSVYEDIVKSEISDRKTLYIYDSSDKRLIMELNGGHASYIDKNIGNEICALFSVHSYIVEEICESWVYNTFKLFVTSLTFKGNEYIPNIIDNLIKRSKLIKENEEISPYTNPEGSVHHYLNAHLSKKWVIKKRDGDFWIFNPDDDLWVMHFDKQKIFVEIGFVYEIGDLFIDEETLGVNQEINIEAISLIWGFVEHVFNHDFDYCRLEAGTYKLYQFDGPNLSIDEVKSELKSIKESINNLVSLIRKQL